MTPVRFQLNGKEMSYAGPAFARVVDVLRREYHLCGTKEGGGAGECGACTVLVDGQPSLSCLLMMGQIREKNIVTIEGLKDRPGFDVLKQAFLEEGVVQCGFCTPGMMLTAYAFLRDHRTPDEEEIKKAMAGNLCRCTGYQSFVRAIRLAAETRGELW